MSDTPSRPLPSTVEDPPVTIGGILARLGPGLIIAGSIVGSGELIGTTKTGAEAGFWLLWLIVIGCVIKVFVQVELGRDAIVRGKATLAALSEVPGPAIRGRGNWLIWYYFLMFAASIGQLGGIVGGVGQALAISVPLTQQGREFNDYLELKTQQSVVEAELAHARSNMASESARIETLKRQAADIAGQLAEYGGDYEDRARRFWTDDRIWALLVAIATSALLVIGHYVVIEKLSTALVALFTLLTVVNVLLLQTTESWGIRWSDLVHGFSFRLPPASESGHDTALATALKTFGIIGVGASELLSYPYFCVEKGYARFTGPRDDSDAWSRRARGWMNVMRWDAWCSMVVYTVATVAFYLLGAAVLSRAGLNPSNEDLMRTLNVMYQPVFGQWAEALFLLGAFAVLYSTYFVANAAHARVFTDAMQTVGVLQRAEPVRRRSVLLLSGFLPFICLAVYYAQFWFGASIAELVLISGMMQALMLPMLAGAALYFRFRHGDRRLRPTMLWDACLWISSAGMLATALSLLYVDRQRIMELPKRIWQQVAPSQMQTPADTTSDGQRNEAAP